MYRIPEGSRLQATWALGRASKGRRREEGRFPRFWDIEVPSFDIGSGATHLSVGGIRGSVDPR